MQCLTQLDVQGPDFLLEMDGFIAETSEIVLETDGRTIEMIVTADSKSLAGELARIAWNNKQICDQYIADTVKHWQLQRIALIDRAILRLAIAELLYRTQVPMKVVLDQAIELAKLFSTAESPQFINGVLDAIAKKLQELAGSEPQAGQAKQSSEEPESSEATEDASDPSDNPLDSDLK
jgi:transcription antitermination factor NusB